MVGARARAQLEYRASFVVNLIGAVTGPFIDFLVILVVFSHVPRLRGWSIEEVALLYGMSGIAFGITDLVVGHLDRFGQMVRMGELDVMLVRPLGSLFQVVAHDFQLRRVGKCAQALVVLAVAITRLDVAWTIGKVTVLGSAIVAGAVIFTSVWLLGAAVCFWTTETAEINNAFTYGGSFLTSYPLDIFGVWVRRLLAFAIPMAFVTYYPALYILGKSDPFGSSPLLRFASPLVAAITAVVAGSGWRVAVRHYRSTGS